MSKHSGSNLKIWAQLRYLPAQEQETLYTVTQNAHKPNQNALFVLFVSYHFTNQHLINIIYIKKFDFFYKTTHCPFNQ